VSIGLDAIRDLREARISHDLRPTIQVEPSLRLEIRKLDRDRHAGKIRQKCKKGDSTPSPFFLFLAPSKALKVCLTHPGSSDTERS